MSEFDKGNEPIEYDVNENYEEMAAKLAREMSESSSSHLLTFNDINLVLKAFFKGTDTFKEGDIEGIVYWLSMTLTANTMLDLVRKELIGIHYEEGEIKFGITDEARTYLEKEHGPFEA